MKLLLLPILVSLFFLVHSNVYAADAKQFDISTDATYTITEKGITSVKQKIRIKNNTEFIFTPSYDFTIGLTDLANIKISNKEGAIPFTVHEKDHTTTLEIAFQKRIIGVDKVNEFTVVFESKSIARKNGGIWQVYIPGLSNPDEFSSYEIFIRPPTSFGNPSVIKPFKEFDTGTKIYYFKKDEIGKGGVALLFGKEQGYAYTLSYHLQNSNLFPIRTDIALPPDTSYQTSYIDSLTPRPENVTMDIDGNWLASYHLGAQEKLDITVKGRALVRSTPTQTTLTPEERKIYTNPQPHWEVRSMQIRTIATDTTTPRAVYEYVVRQLSYDYKRAADKDTRLGALAVLSQSKSAVCLEFTDLFVAVARAAGIPARAVEGYAFTQDTVLKPRLEEGDILHAWPEYYDDTKKAWIMVDPTWGNTTYGLDFFNSFDFDHIAFVIKGSDSEYPIPAGGYKKDKNTNDVSVRFAQVNDDSEKIRVSSDISDTVMAGLPIRGDIIVENSGNKIVSSKTVHIQSSVNPQVYTFDVSQIPPHGRKAVPVTLAGLPFLTTGDITLTMQIADQKENTRIRAQLLPDSKTASILGGIAIGFTIIFTIVAFKIRRLRL